jgi:predicted ATP-dependent endonuclease of OLD family
MRLIKARVQNYRSVIDSDEFEIESLKTILVGPNEAGKTVILKALQQINKPEGVSGFDALRDYPRSLYNDITTGKVSVDDVDVVTGIFCLEDSDKKEIPEEFQDVLYSFTRKLNNKATHTLINSPSRIYYNDIKASLLRMAAHMDKQIVITEESEEVIKPSQSLKEIVDGYTDYKKISGDVTTTLKEWLDDNFTNVEEDNKKEEERHSELLMLIDFNKKYDDTLSKLNARRPVFILFNNYFKVKPSIHLDHLAKRLEQDILDDEYYDYGNLCLLKLLGFTAQELADLGNTPSPSSSDSVALKLYKDRLDSRSYQLNAASVRLTNEITSVWKPDSKRAEADKLKVTADGQYLKVVVEDDLGVDIELDQRSEGFQWLVSFFVVFFSESMDKHKNAILLLDEPGMSLHALKQREFRNTISRLAETNQTIFSTHSPFLVGPDELDIVRVVEMNDRKIGSKVHTTLSSEDPAGLLPLQEALGYDLASSLFSQERNLILEGITDYWYVETTATLLREGKVVNLNEKIALVFANSAGKVVYYATILHAHKLKVAAMLDSDAAGDQAAQQENLVHTLGNNKILRTKDYCDDVSKPEIEDLLRETLIQVVKDEFNIDVSKIAEAQSSRSIIDIILSEVSDLSKYKLAKSYIRWAKSHEAEDLTKNEQEQWKSLIAHINKVLK